MKNISSFLPVSSIFYIFFFFQYVQYSHAAALNSFITNILPKSCETNCTLWKDKITTCVENLDTPIGISMNPISGETVFQGNKIGIYFCVCNSEAQSLSDTCLSCLNTNYCISPVLTIENYKNVCFSTESIDSLFSRNMTCII